MPREKSIVRPILEHLAAIEGCRFRKRGPGSIAGDPDIYGSYFGHHVELEVKRFGQEPTKLQWQRLHEWAATGATCAVVTSSEHAEIAVSLPGGHVYEFRDGMLRRT